MATEIEIKVAYDLVEIIEKYPTARIVTDVGASMLSGWGDLQKVIIYDNEIIELVFK